MTVGQLRAVAEEQLLEIPQLGPKAVADVSAALADPRLRSEDSIELLGLPQAPVISERDQELVRMRQRGAAIAAIARRFGISPERAPDPGPRRLVMPGLSRASGGMPRSIARHRVLAPVAADRGSGSAASPGRAGRSR